MTTLISKTTQAGKSLAINYVGGEFIGLLDGAEIVRVRTAGMYLAAKQMHILGGKVGLTKAEGQILIAAEKAYFASIVIEPSRADLVAEYRGLIDEQGAAYERAHDRQDAQAMQIKLSFDAKIEAAAQAIRDYDRAHPDEIAARNAERAASIESNRWM